MVDTEAPGSVSRDDPTSANVRVAKLRFELRDRSLADLETDGVVRLDRDAHVVREGPRFEAVWARLFPD